jgi:hypothetical protein
LDGDAIQDTPQLVTLTATKSGNTWTIGGTVSDDGASEGETIHFGGLLEGSTTIGSGGSFTITIQLPPGATGEITATWEDEEGLTSNVGRIYIQ